MPRVAGRAVDAHRNGSAPGLQDDAVCGETRCHDDGRPQYRVPGEWHLTRRREDAYPRVAACPWVDKDSFRIADLLREWLQQRLRDSGRVVEDGELITRQRAFGKDVDDTKCPAFHGSS